MAALYLGFTVAFGHSTIRWADGWFNHLLRGGPRPTKPPKDSRETIRAMWLEWLRVVLAGVVALVGIGAMMVASGQASDNRPLASLVRTVVMVVCIWFVAGPAFAGRGDAAKDRIRRCDLRRRLVDQLSRRRARTPPLTRSPESGDHPCQQSPARSHRRPESDIDA